MCNKPGSKMAYIHLLKLFSNKNNVLYSDLYSKSLESS